MQPRTVLALVGAFALVYGQETGDTTSPVATTMYGKVKGATAESRDGRMYYMFRGLPYGKIPARFQKPVNPDSWEDVMDATGPAPFCIQYNYFKKEVTGQEDCTNLNIFTPRLPMEGQDKVLLPVVVYIHPGLNNIGKNEAFDPKYFMDEDVVLVIVNYRLNVFGFLNTGDGQVAGNMGLQDQVQALKFVRDNIENFGGDKDRVTLLGSGSGGADAFMHTLSPASKGLFHNVISMGGSTLSRTTFIRNPVKQAKKIGEQVGCPIDTSENLVNCLKEKDAKEILEKAIKLDPKELNVHKKAWFGPTIDMVREGQTEADLIIPDNPVKLLKEGKIINKVPVILGGNEREGIQLITAEFLKNDTLFEKLEEKFDQIAPTLFIYKDTATDKDQVTKKIREFYFGDQPISKENFNNLTDIFMDRTMGFGLVTQAKLYSKQEAPVYLYYFSHQPETSGLKFWGVENNNLGMAHLDDVQYLFKSNVDKLPFPEITKDHKEYELSKGLIKLLASFAETGKPSKTWGEAKEWKQVPAGTATQWYKIGTTTKQTENAPESFQKRYTFWLDLYKNELKAETETPEYPSFAEVNTE